LFKYENIKGLLFVFLFFRERGGGEMRCAQGRGKNYIQAFG